MNPRMFLKSLWESKTLLLAILVPLLLAPLPYFSPTKEAKAGYCVIVIAFFWVTETLPLAVTSLFPVFMFPMFGIMTAKAVCASYMKDTLMLFLGSLVVAVAIERWNLHKRLALRTLTLVGTQPRWLMMGIMLPTWFMSMWMSNTATTAMMMPIVTAILTQIKDSRRTHLRRVRTESNMRLVEKAEDGDDQVEENGTVEVRVQPQADGVCDSNEGQEDKEFNNLAKVFALCTAYSANIGGIATLTGTPPNIIFKGLADGLYQTYGADNPVNFANWLMMGLPLSFIIFLSCWGWMQIYGQGLKCFRCCTQDTSFQSVKQILWEEYMKMGKMTFAEVVVLINFIALALLWITRNPGFIPGWGSLFEKGFVKDSTPAIFIGVLLFILPAQPPRWMTACCPRAAPAQINGTVGSVTTYQPLLTWRLVNDKLAWGVLLLMGGGFALADGCQVSGLSRWMSVHLESLGSVAPWATALLLSMFIAMATEVTSNSATTTLFVPIAGELAVKLGVHPLYFMIPCTIATSLAFLLPVATPPNAIVFASGYIRVKDMVLGGIPMNIISLIVLNFATNTWFGLTYDLRHLPDAFRDNTSAVDVTTISVTTSVSILNATVGQG